MYALFAKKRNSKSKKSPGINKNQQELKKSKGIK
jgi:hypothetical protein